MKYATFTSSGSRWNNEDALAVVEMTEQGRTLFVLCDGMGGHLHGEMASNLVVKAISNYWTGNPKRKDCKKKIVDAVAQAGVVFETKANGREMGTTMVMAAVEGNSLYVAHCGDSRVYLFGEDGLVYQSKDHKRINEERWELVSNAFFTGDCKDLKPEIRQFEIKDGYRLMLCSDGVSNFIKQDELERILMSDSPLEERAKLLEDYCKEHSRDNFSAIIVDLFRND